MKKQKGLILLLIVLTTLATFLVGWKFFISKFQSKIKNEADFTLGILPSPEFLNFNLSEPKPKYNLSIHESIFKTIPKKVRVFKIKTKKFTKERAVEIAKIFGFNQNPEEKFDSKTPFSFLYYQWKTKNETLRVSPEGTISYKYTPEDLSELKNPSLLPTEEEGINLIKKILNQLGFQEKESFAFKTKITYFKVEPAVFSPTLRKEEADGFEIQIIPLIEGLPIVGNEPEKSLIIARIGNFNKIISFNALLFEVEYNISGTYNLKNYQEVKKEIEEGLGKIVYLEKFILPPGSPTKISLNQVNLNSLTLAYFLDQKNFYLQPIYIISGIAFWENKKTTAIVYFPAVSSFIPGP